MTARDLINEMERALSINQGTSFFLGLDDQDRSNMLYLMHDPYYKNMWDRFEYEVRDLNYWVYGG